MTLTLFKPHRLSCKNGLPGWWKLNKDLEVKGRAGCRAGQTGGERPSKYLLAAYLWLSSAPPSSSLVRRQTVDLSHQEVHPCSLHFFLSFLIQQGKESTQRWGGFPKVTACWRLSQDKDEALRSPVLGQACSLCTALPLLLWVFLVLPPPPDLPTKAFDAPLSRGLIHSLSFTHSKSAVQLVSAHWGVSHRIRFKSFH